MNGFTKFVIVMVVVIYVVSPIDLLPGPIDDVIVMLLSAVAMSKDSKRLER